MSKDINSRNLSKIFLKDKEKYPGKRFEGFIEPWTKYKLREFGKSTGGTSIESEFTEKGEYKVISIGSYSKSSEYIDQGLRTVKTKKTEKRILNKNDLTMILNDKTTSGDIIGRVLLIDDDNTYVYNQRTERIEVNKENFIPEFLYQYLNSNNARSKIIEASQGNTQIYVNWSTISELEYLIPNSLKEQEKIGQFFKKIDQKIQLQHSKVNKVKDIKAAYLSEMFPKEGEQYPKRRFEGFTEPWIKRALSDLGDIITGTTPSTKKETYYSENGIPWVTPTDIYKNITYTSKRHLSKAGQQVSKIVPKNTILVTSIASIGKNTLLGRVGSFNQQINALVPYKNLHNPYFLFTQSFFWSAKMKQTAASGTMQIVNKTEFSKISTEIPELEEQIKIGNFFMNLDNQISNEEEKLAKLEKLKQAYLNDMFV